MALSSAEARALRAGAEALGVRLDEQHLEGLGAYLDLLEAWNRRTNLVAAKDRASLLSRHLLDSLACVPLIVREGARRTADVGSGGGLPGVPVAIAAGGLSVTLIEPRRKKASFLRAVSRECSTWNIRVEEARADALESTEVFEVVTTRAAFSPAEVPQLAGHLVAPGGLLVAFTTAASAPPAEPFGPFAAPETHPYELAGAAGQLQLATWRRTSL